MFSVDSMVSVLNWIWTPVAFMVISAILCATYLHILRVTRPDYHRDAIENKKLLVKATSLLGLLKFHNKGMMYAAESVGVFDEVQEDAARKMLNYMGVSESLVQDVMGEIYGNAAKEG